MTRLRFEFFCVGLAFFSSFQYGVVYAETVDLPSLQNLVLDLQSQVKTYEFRLDEQARMIHVQGQEIAHLKNLVELGPRGEPPAPGPAGGKEELKEHIRQVLGELRLSERKDIPDEKQLVTLYDDGFYLKGKDDTLRIGGWYQGDVNIYNRGNEGDSRFRNRAARLDIRGVLEDFFEYRLYSQFAGSAANLQEAWLAYKYFPNLRIKFGQFKVPFSLESQYSSQWLDFTEKSRGVASLEPAEDLGLMIFGNPFGGFLEYGAGVFNGRLRTLEDNNDNFDLAGRLVLAPFLKTKSTLFRDLYVGGSFTTGSSQETLAGTGLTTAGGTRFLTYAAGTRHTDNRTRFGGELQWIYGPGDVKAEYVAGRFQDVELGARKQDVFIDSWYVSGTYVLTGERKVRNKPIVPKRNFSIRDRGWGAWEAGLRFEQLMINDSPLSRGFITGTDRVDAITAALNWWPNKHIRLMFDYVFNYFSDSVQVGSEAEGSEHLFLGRTQYDF